MESDVFKNKVSNSTTRLSVKVRIKSENNRIEKKSRNFLRGKNWGNIDEV